MVWEWNGFDFAATMECDHRFRHFVERFRFTSTTVKYAGYAMI
ncbi:Uncharacterised protein [Vibrio cholerae]|nr:Uncharacterised protein [Vibrio cholerae]CSC20068.1 Uncharacterised protein [Vibrio cholerae]CSC99310.1 Uncharacterised protein [Vibrio cholerae]